MDRFPLRLRGVLAVLAVLAVTVSAGGCTAVLTTAMYLLGGLDVPAEFDGMREQRVAVVCRPLVQMKYRNAGASKDLAREVSKLLGRNVAKIEMVDYRKVAEWIDENSWDDDYAEIGRALEADLVLGIDLTAFDIFQGQTLYQGNANYAMTVYDCKTGEAVYETTPDPVLWPPNTGIPTSEKQESQFRRKFVEVLADQIARHFYAHDPHAHFAEDATVFD